MKMKEKNNLSNKDEMINAGAELARSAFNFSENQHEQHRQHEKHGKNEGAYKKRENSYLHVKIDDDLHQKIKDLAAYNAISVKELVEDTFTKLTQEHESEIQETRAKRERFNR